MNAIKAFFESSANRAGLVAWGATAITAGVQFAITKQMPPVADLLGLVIGLGLVIVPDNTVTVTQLEKAIADVTAAVATKSPAAIEAAFNDVGGIVEGVTDPKPTTAKA